MDGKMKMECIMDIIDKYCNIEEQLLIQEVEKLFPYDEQTLKGPTEKELNDIYTDVHNRIINSLLSHYLESVCSGYKATKFSEVLLGNLSSIDAVPLWLNNSDIPVLCEKLHILFLNSHFILKNNKFIRKKSKKNLLEYGAVYTPDSIAYDIVKQTLEGLTCNYGSARILDFATGTGRFYRQIVKCMFSLYGIDTDKSILECIYAVDIDPVAINICRVNALSLLGDKNLSKAKVISKHIIQKNALIKNQLFDDKQAISVNDIGGLFYSGFDAIVSNPPYLVLKPNKNKMDKDTIDEINLMAKYFRNSPDYKYSIEGMLNLYQLSIEAMLGMLKNGGSMGVICPSTLFADVSASKLRKYLLQNNEVSYIKYFSEDEDMFENVTQATCIFHLTKGHPTHTISIVQGENKYTISLDDVKRVFSSNWEIPSIKEIEWNILRKLLKIKPLKDCSYIRNKRGELDLSLFKEYITNIPTGLRLVRGNMITENGILDINKEYVLTEFIKKKSNEYIKFDYNKRRLICQQISNQSQKIRLRFVECEKTDILGNSCNYISADESKLKLISLLLNSALLNWRFKVTSTNNHINNYELDELPIIDIDKIDVDILNMSKVERDKKVCELYGLNNTEINYIIGQYYDLV